MKDPERLCDRPRDDLGATLLCSLRSDAPSRDSRKRAMAGALTAAAALKTTSGVAASGLASSLVAWAISGALLGGAVSGGAIWLHGQVAPQHTGHTSAAMPPMPTAPRQVATPAPIASPSKEESYGAVSDEQPSKTALRSRWKRPVEARQPRPAQHHARPAAQSRAGTVGDLRAQRMAIEAAREMLTEGRTADALAALDAYRAQFRQPMFGQEAAVLRIEALVRKGDQTGARRLGQAFLTAHAESPLAQHVRSLTGLQSPSQ